MKIIASPAFHPREQNPYTRLLYKNMNAQVSDFSYRRSITTDCDIVHLHWPEWELNAFGNSIEAATWLRLKLVAIDILRVRGAKVVWTVHNLRAHEGRHPRLEKWFWSAFIRRVDAYITLAESGRVAAIDRFPGLASIPGYVIPHGHYRDEYPNSSTDDARKQLGISASTKVLLFFGQLREYKNVPALIRAFREAPGDIALCIAGRPSSEALTTQIKREAALDSRVFLHLYEVPKERVQIFFRAADLVVLPYRDILNSGAALLSLSFNRPVLVPNRGAMDELRSRTGPEWVRTYSREIDASALQEALTWATGISRPSEADLGDLQWPKLAAQTLQAYEDVIGKRVHGSLHDS
jgi:beta-1,4-mannosyltransferase